MFYIDTTIRMNTPIPAKNRITQAIALLDMINNDKLKEVTSVIEFETIQIDALLMLASHRIDNYHELEFLLNSLNESSPEIVSNFFNGLS